MFPQINSSYYLILTSTVIRVLSHGICMRLTHYTYIPWDKFTVSFTILCTTKQVVNCWKIHRKIAWIISLNHSIIICFKPKQWVWLRCSKWNNFLCWAHRKMKSLLKTFSQKGVNIFCPRQINKEVIYSSKRYDPETKLFPNFHCIYSDFDL